MISSEAIKNGITPKNDIIFKRIFGHKGNEEILKDLLEGILEIKIKNVKLDLATEMLPDFYRGKSSRLDVRSELEDGTIVNVEIQTDMRGYSEKRDLGYWSELYTNSLEKGKDYTDAKKTICIWILDGEVYDFEKYHSKWVIAEKELGKTRYFKDFEIHVIELKKFRKLDIIKPKKKEFWLWFIDHTREELVKMACYSNEEVRKAKEEYDRITADKELMSLVIAEKIDEWDKNAMIRIAREEGIERGMKKGIKKGMEKGKQEANIETAKKMLELGAEIEFIEKATGLKRGEILKLKENEK